MEAQRFPDDYQGILAGAPAISTIRLLAAGLYNIPTSSPTYIPPDKIPAISAAVLLPATPKTASPTASLMILANAISILPSALSRRRIRSLFDRPASCPVEEDLRGPEEFQRRTALSRLPPRQRGRRRWVGLMGNRGRPRPGPDLDLRHQLLRNMVFDNPAWDYHAVSAEKAVAIGEVKTGRIVDAIDPDLRRFEARGGKLIMYHGGVTRERPRSLRPTTTTTSLPPSALRTLRVSFACTWPPASHHCSGGPGPGSFGQLYLPALGTKTSSTDLNPEFNVSWPSNSR